MIRKSVKVIVALALVALAMGPGMAVSTVEAQSSTNWAIVISGGANYWNNHARYWNDLSEMYEILTVTYGYDEDNVFVLYADGDPPYADPDALDPDEDPLPLPPYDGNCWDAAHAHAHYPTDIIDYAATAANLDIVTDLIAASGHPCDTLFVFTTDHGGGGGTLCLWGETISAATFAGYIDDITQYNWRAFELEQCYSGEMIPDLSGPNTVIATAAGDTTSCGAGSDLFYYDPFVYYFNAALKGEFPSPAGGGTVDPSSWSSSDVTAADADSDGKVSFVEAYNYAYPLSTCDEDEQYDDDGDGTSHTGQMPAGGDGGLGSLIFLGDITTHNPVADAGADQTTEQTYYQGAGVTLDGSGSSDPQGDALTYDWTWAGGSATGVSPTVSLPLGTTTITLVVNDGFLNSCPDSVAISVIDTTPPVVVACDDVIVEQATLAGTEVTLSATVSDICDADPAVVWTHGPTAVFPLGDTTVTVTATDASGNTASDTVVVQVVDTTPPEVDAGEDVTVEQTSYEGAPADLPDPVVTDNCDPDPMVVIEGIMDIYPLGDTEVTVTATDFSGNMAIDTVVVHVVDTTPPEVTCLETVNTHGGKVPPAHPKGGPNADGFFELLAEDICDPDPAIYVEDTGSGTVFGPFASGTKIKYTEDADATPEQKKIGSDKGQAGAIDWHIIGNGDACVTAIDFSGNEADCVSYLVPPLPK